MIDAVIILSNHMNAEGQLNDESARRASKGVEVFKESNAKVIITCGWAYRNDSSIAIGDAFKHHLVERYEINDEKILVETTSRDTVGDAYFTKINIVDPSQWKRLIVVTSDYHVKRTIEVFNFVYGDRYWISVVGAQTRHDSEKHLAENNSLEAFRHTFTGVTKGNDFDILNALKIRHPFYNGKVYSAI